MNIYRNHFCTKDLDRMKTCHADGLRFAVVKMLNVNARVYGNAEWKVMGHLFHKDDALEMVALSDVPAFVINTGTLLTEGSAGSLV